MDPVLLIFICVHFLKIEHRNMHYWKYTILCNHVWLLHRSWWQCDMYGHHVLHISFTTCSWSIDILCLYSVVICIWCHSTAQCQYIFRHFPIKCNKSRPTFACEERYVVTFVSERSTYGLWQPLSSFVKYCIIFHCDILHCTWWLWSINKYVCIPNEIICHELYAGQQHYSSGVSYVDFNFFVIGSLCGYTLFKSSLLNYNEVTGWASMFLFNRLL